MEFDRVSTTGRLSSPHLATAAHRAMELALQPNRDTRSLDLQHAVRALCAEARRQGMRAEELIVLFKRTWAERPELHRLSREETGRLLDATVSMCVEEFYSNAS